MRLLMTTMLALGCAALLVSAADAKPRRHKKSKTAAVKTVAAPVPLPVEAAPLPVVTGLNPDGSIRAPIIDDAPLDDYQRVAWCHGILSGDMALAEYIAPIQPVDTTIQLIGSSYLRAYEAALTLSGKGATPDQHALAETTRQSGYDQWQGALKADLKQAAWAYDNWQLPGDCEHAAVRLSGHPNLFGEMATDEEATAISDTLNSGGIHNYEDLPKPVLTAQTAPEDGDAPISTNTLAKRAKQSATLPTLPVTKDSTTSSSDTPPASN